MLMYIEVDTIPGFYLAAGDHRPSCLNIEYFHWLSSLLHPNNILSKSGGLSPER